MGAISRFITSKFPITCVPLFTHKQYKYCVVYTKEHLNVTCGPIIMATETTLVNVINIFVNQVEAQSNIPRVSCMNLYELSPNFHTTVMPHFI
jgi:hypothetical protein